MCGPAAPLALGAILGRIRGELVALGRCADDLQTTIGAIVDGSPGPLTTEAQIELQAADALSQRLERLAKLTEALEAEVCGSWELRPSPEAAERLSRALARLADSHRAADDQGDCDLF
jgi:hypothetical protein